MDSSIIEKLEATKKYLEAWLEQNQNVQPEAQYARVKLDLTGWLIQALRGSPASAGNPAFLNNDVYLNGVFFVADCDDDYKRLLAALPMMSTQYDEYEVLGTVWFSRGLVRRLYELYVAFMGQHDSPDAQDDLREQTLRHQRLEDTFARFEILKSQTLRYKTKVICPCCMQERPAAETTILQDTYSHGRRGKTSPLEKAQIGAIVYAKHARQGWACDLCFAQGRAARANSDIQELKGSYGDPYYAYYDRHFHCEDCGAPFDFTIQEQQYWYEELRFYYESRPNQCLACRRKERAQKQHARDLEGALKELDPNQPAQLAEVAELYLQAGYGLKAIEFLRRARNKTTAPAEKDELLQRIQSIQNGLEEQAP